MNYLNLYFTPREEVLEFPFNQEIMLIPAPECLAKLDEIIVVNETGLIFWQELVSGKTPNEICMNWAEKADIDLSELQDIALHLLTILKPILNEVVL